MDILKLKVKGPFFWLDEPLISAAGMAKGKGVYLWTVAARQGELIYYIGETTRSFASRMKEHLIQYLSGMYGTFEPLAEKRVARAIKDIRLIGNLSNKKYYRYTDEDVKKILRTLDRKIKMLRQLFQRPAGADEIEFKL
jgi:hypothetical protein